LLTSYWLGFLQIRISETENEEELEEGVYDEHDNR